LLIFARDLLAHGRGRRIGKLLVKISLITGSWALRCLGINHAMVVFTDGQAGFMELSTKDMTGTEWVNITPTLEQPEKRVIH
jgi:hypothetical protein